ncbi:MAG: hypothetical protein JW797_15550 [Bradymonadales bacterium]|nr:hypothetical protein [Bradymonadales bacterium]
MVPGVITGGGGPKSRAGNTPLLWPSFPWLVLLLVSLAVGGAMAADRREQVDPIGIRLPAAAVYPPHGLSVAFDHQLHSTVAQCALCHEQAAASQTAGEDLLPTMERCGKCHPQSSDTVDPQACGFCHRGYRPLWAEGEGWLAARDPRFPLVRPEPAIPFRPNLHFSHRLHNANPCNSCHPSDEAGGVALPLMDQCVECHRASDSPTVCTTCHLAGEDGRLQTRFGGDRAIATLLLRPANHGEGFDRRHGSELALDPASCFSCHAEQHCLRCHDSFAGVAGVHPPGFARQHSVSARGNGGSCGACHRVTEFCVGCHIDVRVTADQNHGPILYDRVHPPGWSDGAGVRHSWEAQRDIVQCASCHPESDCVACHRLVAPHGSRFPSRCGGLLSANPEVCLRCHGAAELEKMRLLCP